MSKDNCTVGIICPANRKYAPYVENYINVLEKIGAEYKILTWNKAGIEENVDFSLNFKVRDSDSKKMLIGYVKFIFECKKYLRKNRIDKLIILTAAPAFFMGLRFLNKYRQKYILDIRDDSPFIRKFSRKFKKICSLAKEVIVSSNNFSEWTGRDTVLCHNVNLHYVYDHLHEAAKKDFQMPIRLVFAGMMIEKDVNLLVVEKLANDQNFILSYIGKPNRNKQEIEKFAEDHAVNNITFQGTYQKEEIVGIYKENADIINILRAKTTVNRNALPNKMYDAVLSGVPLIVFDHNEAIAKYVQEYSLGIVVSENDINSLSKCIIEKLNSFDYDLYKEGRQAFLNQVILDMNIYDNTIREFVLA